MADETSFSNTSWQGLIDYGIGRGPAQQAAAAIEASRRSIDATRSLDVTMQAAATASVEHAERLEAAAAASSEQTDKVIDLTVQLKKLTEVITWLTVAAVFFGGIQATAVMVHFYRWYRGWL